MDNKNFSIDDNLPALEKEIGTVTSVEECCPGVYYIEADDGSRFRKEYYVLMEGAPFAGQIWNYGVLFRDMYLFEVGKYASGWEIMQYEVTKYNLAAGKEPVPEEVFHDRVIHAMDAYAEYFGDFPVPYHTPEGYTLRHRRLGNGIYWLETSRGKELLAVSFPIWYTELSEAAITLAKMTDEDRRAGVSKSMCYAFFSKDDSCVPMYELASGRPVWDGLYIHVPALMNALWEHAPEYAMHLNGGKLDMDAPRPDGKHVVGMFPGEGTDFLRVQ